MGSHSGATLCSTTICSTTRCRVYGLVLGQGNRPISGPDQGPLCRMLEVNVGEGLFF
jgi:hypothetical protein